LGRPLKTGRKSGGKKGGVEKKNGEAFARTHVRVNSKGEKRLKLERKKGNQKNPF